jgi:hypothetical protein
VADHGSSLRGGFEGALERRFASREGYLRKETGLESALPAGSRCREEVVVYGEGAPKAERSTSGAIRA